MIRLSRLILFGILYNKMFLDAAITKAHSLVTKDYLFMQCAYVQNF